METGWQYAIAAKMDDIYKKYLPEDEVHKYVFSNCFYCSYFVAKGKVIEHISSFLLVLIREFIKPVTNANNIDCIVD